MVVAGSPWEAGLKQTVSACKSTELGATHQGLCGS